MITLLGIIAVTLVFIASCAFAVAIMVGSIERDIARIKNVLNGYEERRIENMKKQYIKTGKIKY